MKKYKIGEVLPKTKHQHREDKIFKVISSLKIGESVEINKQEWSYKTDPIILMNGHKQRKTSILYGKRFSVRQLLYGKGWLITRKEDKKV